jgi:CRP-like cAMP-binding protein
MYFQQSDILRGLDENFITKFMKMAKQEPCTPGHILYKEGDRADHFYILINGCVKLSIGETGHTVYTVDRPGEVFGWSGLVGREQYAASAECRETGTLIRIEVGALGKLLQKDEPSGLIFYRNLAGSLGNRLLQTYKLVTGMAGTEISRSSGTGQLLESDARAQTT